MVYEASLRKPVSGVRRGVLAAALAALIGAGPLLAAAPAVPTAEVGTGAAGTGFEIDGALEALQQSTVAAQLGGNVLQLAVKAGDRVLFSKYSGSEIKLDGDEFIIMREDEILGIISRAGAAA